MKDVMAMLMALFLGASLMYIYDQQQADAGLPTAMIGYGQNPLVSIGGTAYHTETKNIFVAPSSHDIVVTDLVLTSTSNMSCKRNHKSELILASGDVLGQFETHSAISRGSYSSSVGMSIQHAFAGGIRIPAGETLTLVVTQTDEEGSCYSASSYGVRYMISGYYAQL